MTGAKVMQETLNLLHKAGALNKSDLFDQNYKKIKGTNPQKYSTKYDRVLDKHIQKILDQFLHDPDIEFAILIDKNGYVPTHNTKYSKPETKNYKVDLVNSRSKRIYIDYPGIRKALIYQGKETIKVLYHRDTGETMWNIAASLKIDGKHWGAFLIGVSLKRINEIKNQMLILIITIMFVILSLTLLAILAVIPRKIFPQDLDVPRY
ncbi:MAG: hypothetical protein MI922_06070 [Bacteroidales bacterium]|nr:hypothetical protein [Bacteroidales bacterium]